MHEHKWELGGDISPDGAQEELDPHRVGDDQPEQVLVRLVGQQGRGGQERVVPLQFSLQRHLNGAQLTEMVLDLDRVIHN